ncbi:MAG: peptidylprolyl isomerase [Crocinitomicaceae bacterium]
MKKIGMTLFALIMLVTSIGQTTYSKKDIKKMKLSQGMYAVMSTTKGDILLKLEHDKTPMTVANFIGLAEGDFKMDTMNITKPFYNGLKFHRVIADFMIQGGDPKGNGQGSPGYKFYDEIHPDLKHEGAGILSMANSGPATNGSQFFITHKSTPWLNGKHTIFGSVIKGQDIVDAIEQNDMINTLTIYRFGKSAKKFNATNEFAKKFNAIELIEKEKQERLEKIKAMTEEERIVDFKARVLKQYPKAVQTKSGLMYTVENTGTGESPSSGTKVKVHYTGYFLDGGGKFDSSVDRGSPFEFNCGQRRVIAGWDEGVPLMNKGAKYKLIIPYWLGYGANGSGPIPGYSDLLFDVELIDFGIMKTTGHGTRPADQNHDGHNH